MIIVTYGYVPISFQETLQRAVDSLGSHATMHDERVCLRSIEDLQELQRLIGHTISFSIKTP